MPTFEITVQSDSGFIGPVEVQADDTEAALVVGRRIATEFLAGNLSTALLQQTWVVVVENADGREVARAPVSIVAKGQQARPARDE